MAVCEPNPKVDAFIARATRWRDEFAEIRRIVREFPLSEEIKWGQPCYTFQKKNVVIIQGFNDYCALMFFKGALLTDNENILVQMTENVQSARQIRFSSLAEVTGKEGAIRTYLEEALENEKAGKQVEFKRTEDFDVPEELQARFDGDPQFRTAFGALTPGRQRGYILYFSQPKQSKTRVSRIDKYYQPILEGKGLND